MAAIPPEEKSRLQRKLLEIQREGLIKYGAFLADQLKRAGTAELKKSYRTFLEQQIRLNEKKLQRIKDKL